MEDFQLPADIIDNIKAHFSQQQDNEPCGGLCIIKGKLKYIPFINTSETKDNFIPEALKFSRYGPVLYMLVHGHDDNCIPSEHDITMCNVTNYPWMVINQSDYSYAVISPDGYNNLCGKDYKFKYRDCFTSTHNWFKVHGIAMPMRPLHWKDDWWEHGEDYFGTEVQNWPVKKVDDLLYGDIILFKIGAEVSNHMGVYLYDDLFFHHAVNRLSCKENLYPFWGKHITGIYRYEESYSRGIPRREIW